MGVAGYEVLDVREQILDQYMVSGYHLVSKIYHHIISLQVVVL